METADFFQLKDLEKFLPKHKGIGNYRSNKCFLSFYPFFHCSDADCQGDSAIFGR